MTQIELEGIFAQRRAEHEAQMRELQTQEAQIQTQRNAIREQHGIKMGFKFCQKSGQ